MVLIVILPNRTKLTVQHLTPFSIYNQGGVILKDEILTFGGFNII